MNSWLDKWIEMGTSNNLRLNIIEETYEHAGHLASVEVLWDSEPTVNSEVELQMQLVSDAIECTFKPHLTPEEDMVIGDLFFRSPAIIFEQQDKMFALIPDIDFIEENRKAPHYMDYVKENKKLFYGIGSYEKTYHVYHRRTKDEFSVQPDESLFKFYLIEWDHSKEKRDYQPVTSFLWDRFAKKRMKRLSPNEEVDALTKYAKYTYEWAFEKWAPIVWQQFEIEGKEVGAPVLIVRTAQKPGLGNEDSWREKKSIWNQAWFSSLRSAYGYRLWGKKWKDDDLIRRANLAKQFALSAPQTNGLFPAIYEAGDDLSWENGKWGHSNRRPLNHEEFGHLLDMSWTCYWMLRWYTDIEQDKDLLTYSTQYANRLVELQQDKGNIPAWIHMETGEISEYLIDSPETSMHAQFLAKLYRITKDEKYLTASEKAMQFVIDEIIPTGRWEDFETYWSCSRMWDGKVYGEKEKRSGLYHQCSFSIYWTAEALKELYLVTDEERYLEKGQQVLAELSLYQAVWNPPFINVPVLGGFGVMNTDDEWNDARQSLAAVTYDDYYRITGKEEYKYRSLWAMKASFYMMYCPENQEVKALYENTFPFMDSDDYGFEMENAHHGDNIDIAGEFTIFDWGNGSASSALAEIHYKENN